MDLGPKLPDTTAKNGRCGLRRLGLKMIQKEVVLRRLVVCFLSIGMVVAGALLASYSANACPFCSAVSLTLGQEIKAADAVVVAELVSVPKGTDGDNGAFAPGIGEAPLKSKFKIVETLKGKDLLKKAKEVEAVYFGDSPVGTEFMITAIDPKDLTWATPIPLPKDGRKYLSEIMKLPE